MKKSPAKKKTRVSPLTRVVILVLLAALGWQLYGLRGQLERAQTERDSTPPRWRSRSGKTPLWRPTSPRVPPRKSSRRSPGMSWAW